jgi:hypothetical protein
MKNEALTFNINFADEIKINNIIPLEDAKLSTFNEKLSDEQ